MAIKLTEAEKYSMIELLSVSRAKIIKNLVDKINGLANARVLKAFELNEAISFDPMTGVPRRIPEGVGLQVVVEGHPEVFSLSIHINPMETPTAAKEIQDKIIEAIKNPTAAIEQDMPKEKSSNLIQVVNG